MINRTRISLCSSGYMHEQREDAMKLAAFKSSTLLVLSLMLVLGTPALAARFSNAADPLYRFVRGWRPQRHDRPAPRPVPIGAARPAVRDRGSRRRRRQCRHAVCAVGAARRLHYRLRRPEQCHQRHALRTHTVRFRARQHADRRHHEARQCVGCESQLPGEKHCRSHHHGEGQSGQDQFRLGRRRHLAAHVGRAAWRQ